VSMTVVDGPQWDVGAPSSATATIADAPTPLISIVATDASASEVGPDTGTFTVTRSGSTALALNDVTLKSGGTAEFAHDYAAFSETVSFPAGVSSITVTITPIADALAEGSETMTLTVVDGPHWDVGAPASATVSIADGP